jgi:hypothetical protein
MSLAPPAEVFGESNSELNELCCFQRRGWSLLGGAPSRPGEAMFLRVELLSVAQQLVRRAPVMEPGERVNVSLEARTSG